MQLEDQDWHSNSLASIKMRFIELLSAETRVTNADLTAYARHKKVACKTASGSKGDSRRWCCAVLLKKPMRLLLPRKMIATETH